MIRLTPEEIDRYKRHLVLREVGGEGQQRLKAARVLVVGAGGLGAPMLMYLAAAGVGTIGVIDDDTVSLDNLQRQVLYATASVGRPKVAEAKRRIGELNPHVAVETHAERLDWRNAIEIIARYDIVADGSDNFATRYLVSDACYLARRPLVFAAVGPFDGYVTTFKPHLEAEPGRPNPTYRCLFPEAPEGEAVFNCSEVGVLGSIVGVIGTLQATEVLKEILGIGKSLTGRLLLYDALQARFDEIRYAWDGDNPLNGSNATIGDLSHHSAGTTPVCVSG
ncbi:MAG: hypothetical protein RLZ98_1217 [Pseudomonadota bacterium]|jgi:adenylyltransferase/sulfurtransferase